MSSSFFTDEEAAALGLASLFLGAIAGCFVAATVFGLSLIFLGFGQSLGLAILSFWPAGWFVASKSARLYIAKKKAAKEKEVTA